MDVRQERTFVNDRSTDLMHRLRGPLDDGHSQSDVEHYVRTRRSLTIFNLMTFCKATHESRELEEPTASRRVEFACKSERRTPQFDGGLPVVCSCYGKSETGCWHNHVLVINDIRWQATWLSYQRKTLPRQLCRSLRPARYTWVFT